MLLLIAQQKRYGMSNIFNNCNYGSMYKMLQKQFYSVFSISLKIILKRSIALFHRNKRHYQNLLIVFFSHYEKSL